MAVISLSIICIDRQLHWKLSKPSDTLLVAQVANQSHQKISSPFLQNANYNFVWNSNHFPVLSWSSSSKLIMNRVLSKRYWFNSTLTKIPRYWWYMANVISIQCLFASVNVCQPMRHSSRLFRKWSVSHEILFNIHNSRESLTKKEVFTGFYSIFVVLKFTISKT